MRKWEDIVKDKMEEPEGALPESVFAEFRARREATTAAPDQKRFPLVWAVVPAVAAGLAAILLLQKPSVPEGDIQIIQQPSAPVAVATDTTTINEPEQTTPLIAQVVMQKVVRRSVVKPQELVDYGNNELSEEEVVSNAEEETFEPIIKETVTDEMKDTLDTKSVNESHLTISSPFIPESVPTKPVKMRVGSAAGIVAGGGLVAAIATPFLGGFKKMDAGPINQGNPPDGTFTEPELPKDEPTGVPSHSFPLRLGFSARSPVAERLSVTTGLEYSLYASKFTYTMSGEKTQLAHYLGIPVRLDWTLASNKWLDVYLGGGLEADYCLGATLAGEQIAKDGFGLSLLGAGGIQLKLTKQIGLYVEPQISWTLPSESHVLQTYRSDNPVMFSLTSGIRFIIGK